MLSNPPEPSTAAGEVYSIVKDMMNDDDGGEGVVWVWVKHDKFGWVDGSANFSDE